MGMRPLTQVPVYTRAVQIEMEVHGLDISDLANRTGLHRGTIDNMFHNGRASFETVCLVAKALNVDVDAVGNLQEYQDQLGVTLW